MSRNKNRRQEEYPPLHNPDYTSIKKVHARTQTQEAYLKAISKHDMTFGLGPAGTGKTFLAVSCALHALREKKVSRIVITRPVVEAGEKLGFLPGDLTEKVNPYLRPIFDAFYTLIGPDKFTAFRNEDIIELAPLAYMRGRTLENAFILLDEAQNTTQEQMKMFLTRMGNNSKVVVTGDMTQVDLPTKTQSGLAHVVGLFHNVPEIALVRFNEEDVVRHELVKKIVHIYAEAENQRRRSTDQ